MKQTTGFYPRLQVDTTTSAAVGQDGWVLLTETMAVTGLGRELSAALAPWRRPTAVHDPAKVIADRPSRAAADWPTGSTARDAAVLLHRHFAAPSSSGPRRATQNRTNQARIRALIAKLVPNPTRI